MIVTSDKVRQVDVCLTFASLNVLTKLHLVEYFLHLYHIVTVHLTERHHATVKSLKCKTEKNYIISFQQAVLIHFVHKTVSFYANDYRFLQNSIYLMFYFYIISVIAACAPQFPYLLFCWIIAESTHDERNFRQWNFLGNISRLHYFDSLTISIPEERYDRVLHSIQLYKSAQKTE